MRPLNKSTLLALYSVLNIGFISHVYSGSYNFSVVPSPDSDKYIIIEKNSTVAFYCAPSDFEGSIDSYYWSLPGTVEGFSTDESPGMVTYNSSGEGQLNEASLQIDHIDENNQNCANSPAVVAKVAVLKMKLESIDEFGGGTKSVTTTGSTAILEAERIFIVGQARILPSSSAMDSKLNGRLKIKVVQAGSGYVDLHKSTPPPQGYIKATGPGYCYDGESTVGTAILSHVIGGAQYDDAPIVEVNKSTFYRIEHNNDFKLYLQYQFDGGDWKTIATRTWILRADAVDTGGGNWVGDSVSTKGADAVDSTDTPPSNPPKMNDLPLLSY